MLMDKETNQPTNQPNQSFHIPVTKSFMYSYLPTPPLGQDMTQGQFLSGV